jgi:hypothetical protein
MRIIAFIEDEEVIEKILKHLGLWEVKASPRYHIYNKFLDKRAFCSGKISTILTSGVNFFIRWFRLAF